MMARKSIESTRYGIGEWYGRPIETISPSDRKRYAKISDINTEPCPHWLGDELCNKSGGVCSLATYRKEEDGTVGLDSSGPDFVTICPRRFWQNFTIFKEVGQTILQTPTPVLIKEIGFLQSVDAQGRILGKTVGRIDMVLARTSSKDLIEDWCALEMQAVYFSGQGYEN